MIADAVTASSSGAATASVPAALEAAKQPGAAGVKRKEAGAAIGAGVASAVCVGPLVLMPLCGFLEIVKAWWENKFKAPHT